LITKLHPLPNTVPAGNVPYWKIDHMDHRLCPVCDNDNPKPVVRRPDKLVVHICSQCNMIYLADVPRKKNVNEFYKNYGEFKGYNSKRTGLFQRISSRSNPYISILEKTGGIKDMDVCEIGCSHGNFLELVRYHGGHPFGIEVDDNARDSLNAKKIPNSQALDKKIKYDIVCLQQVLEHLTNPKTMIANISNTLKLDGRLLISVPNGGEFITTGSSWIGFRVDFEHLNYFTLQSISDLLFQHNLYVEHFWEHNQPHIQRNQGLIMEKFSFAVRLKRKLESFFIDDFFSKGSFVLTVLARKI